MNKQRIHEIEFQNDDENIYIINDADGDNNFAYGVELSTSEKNKGQLVTGAFNDTANIDKYMVVVGGGNESQRKNLYTLDDKGNATFAGQIVLVNGQQVATLQDIQNASFGTFNSLSKPIKAKVNLESSQEGIIQTGGSEIEIGLTGSTTLPPVSGGLGKNLNEESKSWYDDNALLNSNFEALKPSTNEPHLIYWDLDKNGKQVLKISNEVPATFNPGTQATIITNLESEQPSNRICDLDEHHNELSTGVKGVLPLTHGGLGINIDKEELIDDNYYLQLTNDGIQIIEEQELKNLIVPRTPQTVTQSQKLSYNTNDSTFNIIHFDFDGEINVNLLQSISIQMEARPAQGEVYRSNNFTIDINSISNDDYDIINGGINFGLLVPYASNKVCIFNLDLSSLMMHQNPYLSIYPVDITGISYNYITLCVTVSERHL